MKYILVIALSVFVICSCGRDIDCADSSIHPTFIGYSLADVDTMVLRRYKAGDGFNTMIDTFLITLLNRNGTYVIAGPDSLQVYTSGVYGSNGEVLNAIHVGYDWKLYIPAKNKTVAITGIVSERNSTHCWKCVCYNRVFSFVADTVIYKLRDDSDYTFYVHR